MITKNAISIGLAAVFTVGCVPLKVIRIEPTVMQANNEYFDTTAVPICGSNECQGFIIRIKSKTDRNLEVNWNKTLYITHGQTSGGFMFEGIVYRDRNNPKSPDIIFGNSSFSKTIWPNNLVDYERGKYGGWRNQAMPTGENGIYLTVNVDGKEITQKLVTNISLSRAQ